MARLPIANWALIGITITISVKILVGEPVGGRHEANHFQPRHFENNPNAIEDLEERLTEQLTLMPLSLGKGKHFAVWELFTCLLVHGDVLHLVGNMFFLFVFGNAVNAKLGHLWY